MMRRLLALSLFFSFTLTAACTLLPPTNTAPAHTPAADTNVSPTGQQEASTAILGKSPKEDADRPLAAAMSLDTPAESEPTPTPDPDLPAWTVLVYLNADNDLEGAGWVDLNEMESAGSADEVNVVVQIDRIPGHSAAGDDWTDARRYEILGDDDPSQLNSLVVDQLGEVNMGDPDTLAEFLAWGIANYPANHYALLLWDHGSGWAGLTHDDSSQDGLSMADLGGGLAQGLAASEIDQLDVVAFDACLMGQLEVFESVRPYARYAVASEALVPGQGWDYERLFRELYAAPDVGGPALARQMVEGYLDYYAEVERDDFVTMSAVDLSALPAATSALETLSELLLEAPALAAGAVADARAGAEAYSLLFPEEADYYAAVDLWHFASILAQRSPDMEVAAAANALMDAVESAVHYAGRGAGFANARGISFYFPRAAAFYRPQYERLPLPAWNRFLNSYHQVTEAEALPPNLEIVHVAGNEANVQQLAYAEFEVAGRNIEQIYATAGQRDAGERLRLLKYDFLIPEPTRLPDGSELYEWRDGVHEDFFIWDTTSPYLSDGVEGDFVLFQPTVPDSHLYSVEGRFRRAGTEQWSEAMLVFDISTGAFDSIWSFQGGERQRAPRELFPGRGDQFQTYTIYLDEEGRREYEPGVTLTLDESMPLRYESRPLPDGDYRLGFLAETASGATARAFTDISVTNEAAEPGFLAYLDPYNGFQFQYPESWYPLTYGERLLYTADADESRRLTVTLYPALGLPNSNRGASEELKEQTLRQFGAVSVLYEEPVFVGEESGLLTAYGYEGADGPQTGLFVTFAHEGTGYVVDVDGPAADETETLAIVDRIIGSWEFRPVGVGLYPGEWATLNPGSFTVNPPNDFVQEELENGWQRFSAPGQFVAMRREPASGAARADIAARWLHVASADVNGFRADGSYPFYLAGHLWARSDFEYEKEDEAMWGFLMATVIGGEEVVAWAEAPAALHSARQEELFLVIIADALSTVEGASGLLFRDGFDAPTTWGTGQMDGAAAEITGDEYRLAVNADEGFFWTTAGKQFGDGLFEVTVRQTAGTLDSGFGLLFRVDEEDDSFYVFEVSGDGYVWLGRCRQRCLESHSMVGDGWFYSDAVRQGLGESNQLRLEASGPDLRFFVNGYEVGRAVDGVLGPGDIGFFVETLGEGGVEVAFDNFRALAR